MSAVVRRPAPASFALLALIAAAGWGQSGIGVENGIRFADGTVQVTSAQTSAVAVRESGMKQCFDALGAEIACAGSGHDGDARPGTEWSANGRFLDGADGTVVDRLTGLMWLKDASCVVANWEASLAAIDTLNAGADLNCAGYAPSTFTDWRMPNIVELATLIDYGAEEALPAGHPFVDPGVGNCSSWSSTTQLDPDEANDNAWSVPLAAAGHPARQQIQGNLKSNPNNCLWPVRTPSPAASMDASLRLSQGGVTFGDGSRQQSAVPEGLLRIPQSGQESCFNEQGFEIVCATTGQDGETQNGVVWPVPRFVDNGDGTVDDALTGLTWLKDADCRFFFFWEDAFDEIADLNAGSVLGCLDYVPGTFDDWRLPSVTQLVSLFDFGSDEGLQPDHPFDFSAESCGGFWSSTSDPVSPEQVWRLLIGPDATSFSVLSAPKDFGFCIWPVRERAAT